MPLCSSKVKLGESCGTGVGVRQGCVMSSLPFNVYMLGCMREMKDSGEAWSKAESER